MSEPTAPGWYADPTEAFDHRYWDGTAWTEHVSTAGVASVSPLPAPTMTTPAPTTATPTSTTTPSLAPATKLPADRRRTLTIVGGAVAVLAALLLVVEYTSESGELDDYRRAASAESTNRQAILAEYEDPDDAFGRVVALQDEIDALTASMRQSDCYGKTTCTGATRWNSDSEKLGTLFDQMADLKGSNQNAVNKINAVKAPEGLWMLSLLGQNDSSADRARLAEAAADIRSARDSINAKIAEIDAWNKSCTADELVSCDAEVVPLERES